MLLELLEVMKKNRFLYHKRTLVLALAAGLICAVPLAASTIEIQFTGLDIEYDGATIVDKDPGSADQDPLNTVTFLTDGVVDGTLMTDLTIDLSIPGVSGIGVGGGTVMSGSGGTIEFDFGGSDFLALDLSPVSVSYIGISPVVKFAFGGSLSTVTNQSLPFGLVLDSSIESIIVSFSTQIDSASLTDDGAGLITGFTAKGTGEVEGGKVIPEPATMILAMFGLVAISLGSLTAKNSLR